MSVSQISYELLTSVRILISSAGSWFVFRRYCFAISCFHRYSCLIISYFYLFREIKFVWEKQPNIPFAGFIAHGWIKCWNFTHETCIYIPFLDFLILSVWLIFKLKFDVTFVYFQESFFENIYYKDFISSLGRIKFSGKFIMYPAMSRDIHESRHTGYKMCCFADS